MLKQLKLEEADQAAAVFRASFDHALLTLAWLHTPDEDRWFFRNRLFVDCQIWGCFNGQELVGIVAFRAGWIDQLYISPTWQRRRIGAALLQVAQERFDRLSLWTFQRNTGARRFYGKHGFLAVRETDGARNEEKDPDVLHSWQREHPERARPIRSQRPRRLVVGHSCYVVATATVLDCHRDSPTVLSWAPEAHDVVSRTRCGA